MVDGPNFPATQRVGILVFNDFEPLDVWGFIEAFSISCFIGTSYGDPPPHPFEIVLISNEIKPQGSGGLPQRVKSMNGPYVSPDLYRDEALAQQLDLLMIPGGKGVFEMLGNPGNVAAEPLLAWVRAMDTRVRFTTSVCTGAAVLASAGVLNGRRAATNHAAFGTVSAYGPLVLWDNVARWVDEDHYVTSAGVSAGTDMAFHLVSRMAGRAVAETAAMGAEYDWHRDPDQAIFYPEQATVPGTR